MVFGVFNGNQVNTGIRLRVFVTQTHPISTPFLPEENFAIEQVFIDRLVLEIDLDQIFKIGTFFALRVGCSTERLQNFF